MKLASCILVAMVAVASGYPTGAPDSACLDMVPQHPATTTSGQPPFKIGLSATGYKPGAQITGTISSPGMTKFRGFLIQARAPMGNNASLPVGEFINPISTAHTVCGMNDMQGLTHNNNTDKTSVAFTWQAPAAYAGDLVFQLTVVESIKPSRFWLKIMSDKVLDCSMHGTSSECAKLDEETKRKEDSEKQGLALRFQGIRRKYVQEMSVKGKL